MIYFVKLMNGEELVGEIVEGNDLANEDEVTVVHRPARVVVTQKGVGLSPYPCTKISLMNSTIIFFGEADESIANGHRQLTGGIVRPSTRIIPPASGNNQGMRRSMP